ncbi:MAG: folate-binding protein [Pseudomonadota bacterium]
MHTSAPDHNPAASLNKGDTLALPVSGVATLGHLGVIRAVGEDTVKFLQGQLTQDLALLGLNEARLAAFCNAKGRMQASFIVFKRSEEDVLLVCSRDLLAQTLKRLSMFVLRAKTKLTDASADFLLLGLTLGETAPPGPAPWSRQDTGAANVVVLYPADGVQRALWCAPQGTALPEGAALAEGMWNWLDARAGIAMITGPVFEAFVPQMLNYESVGGVNFKKGCYPGQEIIARSQFRGTLKRRAYIAHCAESAVVGAEVFHAADAEQPCGLVAAAAANPAGGFDLIISIQTTAAGDATDGKLTIGGPRGLAVALQPLPYALLEDI